jgi:hypothetical protein
MSSKRFKSPQSTAVPVKRKPAASPADERQFAAGANSRSTLFGFFKKSSRNDENEFPLSEGQSAHHEDLRENSSKTNHGDNFQGKVLDHKDSPVVKNPDSAEVVKISALNSPSKCAVNPSSNPVLGPSLSKYHDDEGLLQALLDSACPEKLDSVPDKSVSECTKRMRNDFVKASDFEPSNRRFGKVLSRSMLNKISYAVECQ